MLSTTTFSPWFEIIDWFISPFNIGWLHAPFPLLLSYSQRQLLITIWLCRSSLVAQTVKCLLIMQETRVWYLGREVPLAKEMATYSSILAWKIPWTEEHGRLQSMGSQRVGHGRSDFTLTIQLCNRFLRVLILSLASINIKNPEQLLCYMPQLPPCCLIILYVKLNVKCKLNIAPRSTLTLFKSNWNKSWEH